MIWLRNVGRDRQCSAGQGMFAKVREYALVNVHMNTNELTVSSTRGLR